MEKHAEGPIYTRWGFSRICHNLQLPHDYTTPAVVSSPEVPACSLPEIAKKPGTHTNTHLALICKGYRSKSLKQVREPSIYL